ncbi:MAG: hypothetical protein JXL81_06300 [Deltaproteobacteria bacterium]|nr:hypothetical protein [Deltaproteobacteria bacterium]
MKKLFLTLTVLMFYLPVCHAGDLNAIRQDEVVIFFDDGLENAAVSAARIYPDIKEGLEKLVGWKVDFCPAVYLVKNHEQFKRMAGHDLVVGFAVPRRMQIVIDYSRMLTKPFSVYSIMKHELCHLLLHKNIKYTNLPKWLDEGVSQWVSDGLADILIADYSRIDRAIVTGRPIPFRYLSDSFPVDNENLMLAYAQSKSLVEYIAREHDPEGIRRLLNSLSSGNTIDSAVYEVFQVSFDDLENNWYSAMRKKSTWLTLLINHMYEIIFFLGALSLIIAYVKTIIRKRAQMYDVNDDDDRMNNP